MSTGWEDRAESWTAWVRTRGHDAPRLYPDALFELLPGLDAPDRRIPPFFLFGAVEQPV